MQNKINNAANTNKVEIQSAKDALDKMKYEIAQELGIEVPMRGDSYDWRLVPSYYCGIIGGEIVKRSMQMVEMMVSKDDSAIQQVLRAKEDAEEIAPDFHQPLTTYKGPSQPIQDVTNGVKH